ncbi:thiol:disulfide interchange protein [Altererythrobacter aerius]|uniref:Thiol:disulfide interchange protein n=1 Tax=Tsuneonella aeria TaxID=1837929 RepID=A0A6I4TDM0_9SPHN|nr:protein-disulfide reductase DsbD domain-containing protein [Tsuneonella aeria]MXO74265.1 thiol:disulfide interchange protein [Tsuneonella aeria]
MHARTLPLLTAICALFLVLLPGLALAQVGVEPRQNHIAARLVAEGPAEPGETLTIAIAFDPEPGWHGYWSNPGDAGYGMELDWELPAGWRAGEPQYPVPQKLVIGGLMNHIYEGPYSVLVDLVAPAGSAEAANRIALDARWLACTDTICVPEQARLALDLSQASPERAAFDQWRAAIPALLDQPARYAIEGGYLRLAVPLPRTMPVTGPHVFIGPRDLVDYAAPQAFARKGDLLIARIPLAATVASPDSIEGILALDDGDGIRFRGEPGAVPADGTPIVSAASETGPLWLLAIGALAGGLLLNIMPCVFPILSLKALSLARAGESDGKARIEGLAYTGGVMLATIALGAVMLALRAGGEAVGWAFQLQEPAVVVALLVLAGAITANFAGLFHLPSLSIDRGGEPAGAFATGLLAAFVATPCTGPFMAAAMGAALLLPPVEALLLFTALGLGLALPFLALGFVPRLRRMLPRPGPWMERFRRIMAIPMGLTTLALVWLCWRLGGPWFALGALLLAALAVGVIVWAMRERARDRRHAYILVLGASILAVCSAQFLPRLFEQPSRQADTGMLSAQPFTEDRLAQARASGRPVFVWFTADWCLTCKVNEQVAIEREPTRAAFERAGVVALVGDWTRRDPAITRFLADRGVAGIPLYLWYAPGAEAEVLPQVLSPDSLVTLAADVPEPPGS